MGGQGHAVRDRVEEPDAAGEAAVLPDGGNDGQQAQPDLGGYQRGGTEKKVKIRIALLCPKNPSHEDL